MSDCAYCGDTGARTVDHVPPKCLFPKPRPDDLITVPCCEECREGTSKDDEYFWTMLVLRARLAQHPDVQSLLPKVIRSLKKPQKEGFVRSILEGTGLIDLETEGGLYLGKAPTYEVDFGRMTRVVKRTIKGLYWHETDGERLRSDTHVTTYALENFEAMDQEQAKALIHLVDLAASGDRGEAIGKDTFRYSAGFAQDRPRTSVWLLTFYEGVQFLGVTIDGTGEQGEAA